MKQTDCYYCSSVASHYVHRSVILFIIFGLNLLVAGSMTFEVGSIEIQSLEVSDTTGDDSSNIACVKQPFYQLGFPRFTQFVNPFPSSGKQW